MTIKQTNIELAAWKWGCERDWVVTVAGPGYVMNGIWNSIHTDLRLEVRGGSIYLYKVEDGGYWGCLQSVHSISR